MNIIKILLTIMLFLPSTVMAATYQQVCETEQVPVYETVTVVKKGNAGANALLGMIIGGIIGKNIGGDDNAAGAGAVIGGVIGADKAKKERLVTERRIIGYREEVKCRKVQIVNNAVGAWGEVVAVEQLPSSAVRSCKWVTEYVRDMGYVKVERCHNTYTETRLRLIVEFAGRLYVDYVSNLNVQVGENWKLTNQSHRY